MVQLESNWDERTPELEGGIDIGILVEVWGKFCNWDEEDKVGI